MISNEQAADIVVKMRAYLDAKDELTAPGPPEEGDMLMMLVLKLYDDVQAISRGTAFLGVGGGIKPVQKVEG